MMIRLAPAPAIRPNTPFFPVPAATRAATTVAPTRAAFRSKPAFFGGRIVTSGAEGVRAFFFI
jgi:hypothetical protein